jgi:DNA-binding NarL/FixJ family response regulator
LFADDHPIVRDGFAAIIAAERDMVSIGEVETGRRGD